jgi:phosphate transport system substrate-binding protein
MKQVTQLLAGCLFGWLFLSAANAETLTIPGSGNPEYVLGELAKEFNARHTAHQVVIPPSTGTAGALRAVTEGSAGMGRIGRPLTSEERGGLIYRPLGRDPVAFVGGAGVSVRNITRSQVTDVYLGKSTNWRDIGGKSATIRAIGREVTDASRQAIMRNIDTFSGNSLHESIKVVHLDPQMIELLDRYPSSLGFMNRSALFAAKTRLVVLALDSIEPNPENVEHGRYPLWLEIGLIYKSGALSDAGRAFLMFVDSPAGVQILRTHGVIVNTAKR